MFFSPNHRHTHTHSLAHNKSILKNLFVFLMQQFFCRFPNTQLSFVLSLFKWQSSRHPKRKFRNFYSRLLAHLHSLQLKHVHELIKNTHTHTQFSLSLSLTFWLFSLFALLCVPCLPFWISGLYTQPSSLLPLVLYA